MSNPVSVYLQEFYSREGLILETRFDQQSGEEVVLLPVPPLMLLILSSTRLYGLLRSMDIPHESS